MNSRAFQSRIPPFVQEEDLLRLFFVPPPLAADVINESILISLFANIAINMNALLARGLLVTNGGKSILTVY